jgi:hypothetical protein
MDYTLNQKNSLIVILIITALFFGLYPHSDHCSVLARLPVKFTCPDHTIHLAIGLFAYLGAVFLSQGEYLKQHKIKLPKMPTF